jgi:hypothetical protein
MSTLAVNTITNAAGGNTAQINGMTPTAQSLQGFRNRIINGDMRIDQRNNGASVTPTGSTYTLDRWRLGLASSQRMSVQRVSDAPAGFTNSILFTVTTAGSATAGELMYLQQNIEGFNVSDLGFGTASAQPVTASFWVKSSVTGLKSISLINGATNRSYCTTYNIDVANTWEYKTVTMPGDTTGTWETGNGNGLELHFNFQVGPTFETTLNAWAAGRFYSAASVPDITDTSGATISFTGVQLEAGSVATPFERRDYGRELIMCQRYYERRTVGSTANERLATTGLAVGTTTAQFPIQHLVQKRASPAVNVGNLSSSTTYDGGASGAPTTWNLDHTGLFITNITISGLSSTALGRAIHWTWNNASPTPFVEINSEL